MAGDSSSDEGTQPDGMETDEDEQEEYAGEELDMELAEAEAEEAADAAQHAWPAVADWGRPPIRRTHGSGTRKSSGTARPRRSISEVAVEDLAPAAQVSARLVRCALGQGGVA